MKLYILAGLLLALSGVQEPQPIYTPTGHEQWGQMDGKWDCPYEGFTFFLDKSGLNNITGTPRCVRVPQPVSGGHGIVIMGPVFASRPFDVPPKEWDGPELDWGCQPSEESTVCMDTRIARHHRACEDKSRFLLMSEDGKWHCLALTANRERERGGAR